MLCMHARTHARTRARLRGRGRTGARSVQVLQQKANHLQFEARRPTNQGVLVCVGVVAGRRACVLTRSWVRARALVLVHGVVRMHRHVRARALCMRACVRTVGGRRGQGTIWPAYGMACGLRPADCPIAFPTVWPTAWPTAWSVADDKAFRL